MSSQNPAISKPGQFASELGPLAVFADLWFQRNLILRLVRREIEARYKGTILGLLWSVLVPLLLLSVYTFIFSVVFPTRWNVPIESKGHFALVLFAGLIIFNMFSDCLIRAPTLMLNNAVYIKKVVFPLEVLPWVVLLSSIFNAFVSLVVLAVGYFFVLGIPPLTALLFPLIVLPLLLVTIGLSLFLASVGVFIRDLNHAMGIFLMILMFTTPLFYPLSALPERYRFAIQLSPLTMTIEDVRGVLFWGVVPDAAVWGLFCLCGILVAWLGHVWFMKTRKGFADVI